jgi:hypothetical protein
MSNNVQILQTPCPEREVSVSGPAHCEPILIATKQFTVDDIPNGYPFPNAPQGDAYKVSMQMYCHQQPPSPQFGNIGDIFFATVSREMYVKMDVGQWQIMDGIPKQGYSVTHPIFRDHCLWITHNSLAAWYDRGTFRSRRSALTKKLKEHGALPDILITARDVVEQWCTKYLRSDGSIHTTRLGRRKASSRSKTSRLPFTVTSGVLDRPAKRRRSSAGDTIAPTRDSQALNDCESSDTLPQSSSSNLANRFRREYDLFANDDLSEIIDDCAVLSKYCAICWALSAEFHLHPFVGCPHAHRGWTEFEEHVKPPSGYCFNCGCSDKVRLS